MNLDVGQATVLAIAVFTFLFWLANRFNASEIRRTRRAHVRELLAIEHGGVVSEGDRFRIHVGGTTPRLTIVAREGALEYRIAIECAVDFGTLMPFDARGDALPDVLGRHGASAAALDAIVSALGKGDVRALHVSCDGANVRIEGFATSPFGAPVRLAADVARSGARVVAGLPSPWRGVGDLREREVDGKRVTLEIHGGLSLTRGGARVPREIRDDAMTISEAITRLRGHARAAELTELAHALDGRIATRGDRLALVLPLGAAPDAIESAAHLLARLEDPAPSDGAFR